MIILLHINCNKCSLFWGMIWKNKIIIALSNLLLDYFLHFQFRLLICFNTFILGVLLLTLLLEGSSKVKGFDLEVHIWPLTLPFMGSGMSGYCQGRAFQGHFSFFGGQMDMLPSKYIKVSYFWPKSAKKSFCLLRVYKKLKKIEKKMKKGKTLFRLGNNNNNFLKPCIQCTLKCHWQKWLQWSTNTICTSLRSFSISMCTEYKALENCCCCCQV